MDDVELGWRDWPAQWMTKVADCLRAAASYVGSRPLLMHARPSGELPTVDEQRKHAYRWLLYWAMLDIRPLHWAGRGWRQRLNPLYWWSCSRRVRIAGSIADWLHNLALFSAIDFAGFDEERFWRDYQWLLDQHPGAGLERYRVEFERRASSPET